MRFRMTPTSLLTRVLEQRDYCLIRRRNTELQFRQYRSLANEIKHSSGSNSVSKGKGSPLTSSLDKNSACGGAHALFMGPASRSLQNLLPSAKLGMCGLHHHRTGASGISPLPSSAYPFSYLPRPSETALIEHPSNAMSDFPYQVSRCNSATQCLPFLTVTLCVSDFMCQL
jgi:hypothetical protein